MSGLEAIGAASNIAGLFNTAVAWFDYVYVAKQTWPRLQTHFLHLDNAQTRLTRWGQAVGLSGSNVVDEESLHSNGEFMLNEKQEAEAAKTFAVVFQKFEKCQKICQDYKKRKEEDEISPDQATWKPMNRYLHNTMQDIVNGRKNKVPVLRKAKFAIYDEKHLKDLIKDINDHIDKLYQIYPPPEEIQAQLGKEELDKLTAVLQKLEEVVKGRDQVLGSALQTILNQKVSE